MTGLCVLFLAAIIFIAIKRINRNNQLQKQLIISTVTPITRGEDSERRTILKLIQSGINPKAIFHDCYLRRANGIYTQIDIIVATKVGIISFEIKDYSGWIFGDFEQKYWTQTLAYGNEKHRFYNPIMQNENHINAIRENLPSNNGIPILSVVVFFGDCLFKNVTIGSRDCYLIHDYELKQTMREILSRPEAEFGDKHEIMRVLTASVRNGDNQDIITLQRQVAAKAAQNRPKSTYSTTPSTSFIINRHFRLPRTRPFQFKIRW